MTEERRKTVDELMQIAREALQEVVDRGEQGDQLTAADAETMSPAAIVEAKAQGRFDQLLVRGDYAEPKGA